MDITILEKNPYTLDLEITTNSVGIYIDDENSLEAPRAVFFDMRSEEDRKQMKILLKHLQHQINIHECQKG